MLTKDSQDPGSPTSDYPGCLVSVIMPGIGITLSCLWSPTLQCAVECL
jgi:hypothetical protein